jgi:GNAT superfamily N-acetyltransferase
MKSKIEFDILSSNEIVAIAKLGKQLNPKLSEEELQDYLIQMFAFDNYICFGVFQDGQLIGISSGWTTIRFYSGKQLEVDNVIIDETYQSKGVGKLFFEYIEDWAKKNSYKTIELNTYVQNSKSHKFYYNQGFSVLGFHFWKQL